MGVSAIMPTAAQPQELAVTILGNELLHRPVGTAAWSGGLVELLGRFGPSPEAARAALGRLVRRGLVERTRQGREVSYRMSDRTRRALVAGEGRILAFGRDHRRWDGAWTVVSYALGDGRRAQRDRLRGRLAFLGFGLLRDGTWIAPRDRADQLAAVVDELRVGGYVEVFVGHPAAGTDPAALLDRAWDTKVLEAAYRGFLDAAAPLDPVETGGCDRLPDGVDAIVARTALMHRYRTLIATDPELPDQLLPPGSARPPAVERFRRAWHALAPPAAAAFDELCRPTAAPARPNRT
jgi:phenylacetic acid degradation operon negative regulatory protein